MDWTLVCADALDWLRSNRDLGSIVTSLPDMEEIGSTDAAAYEQWFSNAARQCFASTSRGHPTIFYQTDRLISGRRLSKAFLLMIAAKEMNRELVWHKIVLRRDAGKIDLRRPGFSHLICFGDEGVKPGTPTSDVIHAGAVLYPNGMGLNAATVALQAARRHGAALCDPFCGRGTVLAVANGMGFEKIVGVDIDAQQIAATRTLCSQTSLDFLLANGRDSLV